MVETGRERVEKERRNGKIICPFGEVYLYMERVVKYTMRREKEGEYAHYVNLR